MSASRRVEDAYGGCVWLLVCGCGYEFEPRGYRRCPACGEWVPSPTRRQGAYLLVLSELLGIDYPSVDTPEEAARAIDELLLFIDADPDIRPCAAEGCPRFVNRTRKRAHTYCAAHRAMRS